MAPSATTSDPEGEAHTPGQPDASRVRHTPLFRVSAVVLFVSALIALGVSLPWLGIAPIHPLLALGFVAFGLFTILCGFPHPYYGHVSFDRVAQYSSLLIFGPIVAAMINGLASLLYPWRRLRHGEAPSRMLATSLANAGMMCIVILLSGGVYLALDGRLPLVDLQQRDIVPIVAMAVTAHVLNELIIAWLLWSQGGDVKQLPSRFEYSVEFISFAAAVMVAVGYNTLDSGSFALLVLLLGVAMLVLHRFALLRISLEEQVAERTRELQIKSEELDRQAKHDSLTGLYNRRFVDQRLAEHISVAQLNEQPLCVAVADLDHFKQVNDHFSHSAGDETLKRCAHIFHDNLRESDIVARYGGEEFLLCLPHTHLRQARVVCERIRHAIQHHEWNGIADGLTLSISIGVAELQDGMGRDALIDAADRRMYAAKQAGRNRVISS